MKIINEFKEFVLKGNAFDLAVGVIIGGAFNKIVTAITDDLLLPLVAAIIGKPDFSSFYFALGKGAELIPEGTSLEKARQIAPDTAIFAYGNFITVVVNFLLLAIVIFLMVKSINKIKKTQFEEQAAEASSTDQLLIEIRDELKKK
ncbi:large conductance mechanosensitive channel protein MscL [Elizabethkingia argentiflava]|uniref:Large-conductance mechanosensitive channel n=1 Tax=Elizabethkingia argenteiflava TaxID=2681556 RepID=A0A845PWZ6_9FLAO|nr:large conductance mechanosensitive channel protein MscL [Elizabethkingia argenteiflava]NAW51733.1 large conductance mechanosensitive channel protein MscL [Elizabethkingia argenteiflava]